MQRPRSTFRVIVEPLALAIVLAFAVRAFLEFCEVPSESMSPTLHAGDHIVVTPYFSGGAPQRGDVIVFRSPADLRDLLVKRVIGVPGDLVESREGRVVISGHVLAEPYLTPAAMTSGVAAGIVPGGTYFVLGDNRTNSVDSRAWGFLPEPLVIGRARMILWGKAPEGEARRRRLFIPIR